MKSLTASLWRDYQSCRYIVAEVEFRCSKIEDILQQQILKCFSSSLWQIRKLKFTCWPQTSPIFWVSYVFFLVQKSEASVVFDAFNDELFEKKNDRGDGGGPSRTVGIEDEEPRGAEGSKREVIQRHAAMQRLPLTT